MAQISPIKFSRDLQKELFPDNSFYKHSKVEGGIAIDVETIQLPVAGSIPSAKSGNPTTLPLPVLSREDSIKSYSVEQLYADPQLITREEQIVLNYDKQQDLAQAMAEAINERAGDIAAINWGPTLSTNILTTTGTSTRTAAVTGTTGTRKRIILADMIKVRKAFNKMNLPSMNKIYGLLTPEQVEDLLLIDEFVDYDKTGELSKLRNGELAYIMGFHLLMRNNSINSNGLLYSAGGASKKALDAAVAATDSAAALFWHADLVRHAEGHAATFIDRGKPEYLGGTLLSSVVRFGATFSRPDQKGIIALVEATP